MRAPRSVSALPARRSARSPGARSALLPLLPLLSLFSLFSLGALATSCSWGRFDQLEQKPPVVLLDRGGGVVSGFGSSLATASSGGAVSLLVGGQAGFASGAIWTLGTGEDPPLDAKSGVCEDFTSCRLIGSPAAVPDQAGGHGCFVHGVGLGGPSLGPSLGLLGDCADGPAFKLGVPDAFLRGVLPNVFKVLGVVGFSPIASAAAADGQLVVASPDAGLGWVYTGGSYAALAPPSHLIPAPEGADRSFGVAVAALGPSGTLSVAISAPGVGQVYLYDVGAPGVITPRGCVSGPAPYGVVLSGFNDGPRRLLAVSDGATMADVLDIDALSAGPCAAPSGPALRHSYRCAESADATGCDGALFGYALAAGDVDGDGHPELLVGAPGMSVRGSPHGGAVQVFSLAGEGAPVDTLYLSSDTRGERLGFSLAVARVAGRDVVIAGAPGKPEVALFYCSALGGAGAQSERCQ